MTKNVVGRETDGKQIGVRPGADVLVNNQFLGEIEFVFIGKGCGADYLIETRIGTVFAFAMRSRAQKFPCESPNCGPSISPRDCWS